MQNWPEYLIRGVVSALAPADGHDTLPSTHAALWACTLVNTAFYHAALPHIFREITMNKSDRCTELLDLISSHEKLKIHIQKVTVSQRLVVRRSIPDSRTLSNIAWPSLTSVPQLISSLPNLQRLNIHYIPLGCLEVEELTSYGGVLQVPHLEVHNCLGFTMCGLARVLEYMNPSCLRLKCTVDDNDSLPPPWMDISPKDRTQPAHLNELQLVLEASHDPVVMLTWLIAQDYARSIRTLTLAPYAGTFHIAWAIVQQAAGTLEQLSIDLPNDVPSTLAPIIIPALTSLRIHDAVDSSLNTAVAIVERCVGPHSAGLRGVVLGATLKGEIVAQSPTLLPWRRLDHAIASTPAPTAGTDQSIFIHVTQPTSTIRQSNSANEMIRSCMPFTSSH